MLNTSSTLYKSEWLDLVFKNRNKNYGAYALRSGSSGTTLHALFIAAPLFILFFAAPLIYKYFNHESQVINSSVKPDDRIIDLTTAPPVQKNPKPEEKQKMPKIEPIKDKVKMVKPVSNPVVIDEPMITEPPTLDEIDHAVVAAATQPGIETNLTFVPVQGTGNSIEKGNSGENGLNEDTEIHNISDIQTYPEFEGGMKAWAKFIQRNLKYPVGAQEVDVHGKVFISFVIEKNGAVSNVIILKGIGYGCDEEAIRVISKSPKWKPGRQNNQNVRVRYTMPLSFTISQ